MSLIEITYSGEFKGRPEPISGKSSTTGLKTIKYKLTQDQLEGLIVGFIFRPGGNSSSNNDKLIFKNLQNNQIIDHDEIMLEHTLDMETTDLDTLNESVLEKYQYRLRIYEIVNGMKRLTLMIQYNNEEFLEGLKTAVQLLLDPKASNLYDEDENIIYEKNDKFTIQSWDEAKLEDGEFVKN